MFSLEGWRLLLELQVILGGLRKNTVYDKKDLIFFSCEIFQFFVIKKGCRDPSQDLDA